MLANLHFITYIAGGALTDDDQFQTRPTSSLHRPAVGFSSLCNYQFNSGDKQRFTFQHHRRLSGWTSSASQPAELEAHLSCVVVVVCKVNCVVERRVPLAGVRIVKHSQR